MATDIGATALAQPIQETLVELKHGCTGLEELVDSTFGELEQLRAEVARRAQELQAERVRIDQEWKLLQEDRASMGEELKQFCHVLKNHLPELVGSAAASAPAPADPAPSGGDPVIDSVMAQFSKLQKQIAQRRGAPRQSN